MLTGAHRSSGLLGCLLAVAAAVACRPYARATVVYQVGFDSAAGTSNGSAITGVSGGTATIRDNGGTDSTSAVVSDAPDLGGGGYLRAVVSGSSAVPAGVAPQGATFIPESAANSLAAMYSVKGGQAGLNGGYDFFFRPNFTDIAASGGQTFRALDVSAVGSGGLRIVLSGTFGSNDIRLETITATGGITLPGGSTTNNVSTTSNTLFQLAADTVYHLGVTYSTDVDGNVTVRLFGVEGSAAINTSAASLAEGLLASSTFNLNEAVVTSLTGLPTGAYDFGILQSANAARTQDFDEFRLYDAVPAEFAANIPEPTALGLLMVGGLLVARRSRRA